MAGTVRARQAFIGGTIMFEQGAMDALVAARLALQEAEQVYARLQGSKVAKQEIEQVRQLAEAAREDLAFFLSWLQQE